MSEADEVGNFQAVIPLSIARLRKVASTVKDPNDLLFKLLSPKDGFFERLKQGSKDNEMTSLLLKVTALALSAVHRSSRIEFLRQVNATKFLQQDLTNFLKSCTVANYKITSDTLKDIMRIIEALNQSFPSRSIRTVTALTSLVKYLVYETDKSTSGGELGQEFKRLEDGLAETRKHFHSGTVLPDQEKEEDVAVPEFCNFKRLTIAPTEKEIASDEAIPYLRENKIYLEYKNVGDYLDVQFRLLKEDLLRPLRESLAEFKLMEKLQNGNRTKSNVRVYVDVKIQPSHCSREGLVYKVSFDTSRLRHVSWELTKRLLPGSLVCLSSDNFARLLVGTIADRNPEDLRNGITYIHLDQSNNDAELLRFANQYAMIESPAYYEPYKDVLSVLQQVDESKFPFESYFLNQKRDIIPPPKYLQEYPSKMYDFSSLARSSVNNSVPAKKCTDKKLLQPPGKAVPVLNVEDWPCSTELGLDESQYGALRTALTKEFVVIQGPPGTGKTFLGLKIMQLLLDNNKWNRLWEGPILLVSYTNHALDQFLEDIIKLYPEEAEMGKLVRIGHKSSSEKSELMLKCSLNEIRKKRRSYNGRYVYILKRRIRKLEIKIMKIMACIHMSETLILNYETLTEFMNREYFNTTNTYLRWLCGEENEPDDLPNDTFGTKHNSRYTYLRMFECEMEDDYESSEDEDDDECKHTRIEIPEYSYDEIVIMMTTDTSCEIFLNSNLMSDGLRAYLRRAQVNSPETKMREHESQNVDDIWLLNLDDRWRLYGHWMSRFVHQAWTKVTELLRRFSDGNKQLDEMNNFRDFDILKEAKVVAMTTTGAAKRNEVLRQVGPRVVMVEEAAEVLEGHVVASISPSCEHLILIGDHQQLRPKPADYALSKQYRLDISLFEKVVLNKLHCERLEIQHRMRPEIAELLVPHIYKSLSNHESVSRYRNVAGVFGNLFFVNHKELENDENEDRSHSNIHEARFMIALCTYLLNVGYSESEITLLTTYTGQLLLMRNLMPHTSVRITTVDNYQGEENTIILLSLVRSNRKSSIGFLEIANRVCVLLSRARHGLYIIGNGELLSDRSVLWRDILGTLKANDRYVDGLSLGCRRHPDQKFVVKTTADFREVPSHGCIFPCEYRLDCGHVCDRMCHELDENHLKYVCRKPCERKCPYDHPCEKRCHEICGDCTFKVRRTLEKCGHAAEMMCHVKVEDFKCMEPCEKSCTRDHPCKLRCYRNCLCSEPVERILPKCQHKTELPCHQEVNEYYKCMEMVEKLLPKCSHVASMPCYMHESQHKCREPCARTCPRGHLCRKQCSQTCSCDELVEAPQHEQCKHEAMVLCFERDSYSCQERCERMLCSAGHRCPKLCYQPCGACRVVVRKELLRCKHTADLPCEKSVVNHKCQEKCQRSCPNGHYCQKLCFEPCKCTVEIEKPCPKCNEATLLECWRSALQFECQHPCKETLPCGHTCQAHCGASRCTQLCKVIVDKVLSCSHSISVECSTANKKDFTGICRQLVELENEICEYGNHLKLVECQNAREPGTDCLRPTFLPCINNNPKHQIKVLCHIRKLPDSDAICKMVCNVQLQCGHNCRRKCSDCATSGTHNRCRELCKRPQSFCRHRCQLPCSTSCGRCKITEQQIISCQHKSHHKMCSASRNSCLEPCTWKCPHHGCTAVCSEPCDRNQCDEPCTRLLECRHRCAGLCGEPCPEKCRRCHRKDLVGTCQRLGAPFGNFMAFLVLRGCGHVVPVSVMDAWVAKTAQHPPYKIDGDLRLTCPVCGERVGLCPRYNRILKAYEMHLNVARARSYDGLCNRGMVLDSAKRWFRENSCTGDRFEDLGPLKTLKIASACILNDIAIAAKPLQTSSPDDYSLRLRPIRNELKGFWKSWDFSEPKILSDVLKLYAVYLEIKTRQIPKLKILTGPRLSILDRCTELLNTCKELEKDDLKNFRERWTIVEKVNHLLCTKLELSERKDNISDYIQTLNTYFDNAHDSDQTLYWQCCSKGHVFPSEDSICWRGIDERCSQCLFLAKFGILDEFFAERKNTLPPTKKRFPVFVEKMPSAFANWTRKDVNANTLGPPTASRKPKVFQKLTARPIGVVKETDSAKLFAIDCRPDSKSSEHEPFNKSADSAKRKYKLPPPGKNNTCDSTTCKSLEKPSIRRPERPFSLRMGLATKTEEETLTGLQDLDPVDPGPGKNSWRRSESSSIPSSGRKERPEVLGNWRDRSEDPLNSTKSTSFDGMRCRREGKTWQKPRRVSDNQEEKSTWRESRAARQDKWRKPERCERKPEIETKTRLQPEAKTG